MTYGGVNPYTVTFLENKCKEMGIPYDSLGLEPQWEDCVECDNDWKSNDCEACEYGAIRPLGLYEITVIFGGALDEVFELNGEHIDLVTDWVAESCKIESEASADHEEWEVILAIPHDEDPTVISRIRSDEKD